MNLPERRVRVAVFNDPAITQVALRKLRAAGIEAYTGSGFYRGRSNQEIRVAESDVETAKSELASLPDISQPIVCPQCRGTEVTARPAIVVMVLAAAVVLSVVVGMWTNAAWALIPLALGFIIGPIVEKRVGHWKCESCANVWRTNSTAIRSRHW